MKGYEQGAPMYNALVTVSIQMLFNVYFRNVIHLKERIYNRTAY